MTYGLNQYYYYCGSLHKFRYLRIITLNKPSILQ